jgi:outer membrane lipoprotein SlyB
VIPKPQGNCNIRLSAEDRLNKPIHKRFIQIIAVVLALVTITLVTGCSQKPSAADNAAQIQAAVDKALAEDKAKQEAASQAEEKRKQEAEAAEKRRHLAEERRAAERARSRQAMASPAPADKVSCRNCGMVVSIKPVETEGQGSGLGVLAGGVLGGLLGNQVGNGSGRDLATVAGAVGGAVAGNKIEKEVKKATTYDITVRMDTGETTTFNQATVPSLAIDQRVKIENGRVVRF